MRPIEYDAVSLSDGLAYEEILRAYPVLVDTLGKLVRFGTEIYVPSNRPTAGFSNPSGRNRDHSHTL